MLKAYQRCSLRIKKHLAIVRQLRHLSKNHQLSLKKITASKFYSTQNDQVSKFSSIMYCKDQNLHIVNSNIITNLNAGYNSYTQIENACNKISGQFAAGTFYLNNNYPTINCTNNFTRQNQSFRVKSSTIVKEVNN
ncbi:hypothetical protein HYU06_04645 [Candidatus Woesearchaeota archaeon]|nr:hypothetical protein [Candidatus Woesearchaeota archaeon]